MNQFINERILITGGNKGLGKAIANSLAEMGAKITIVARNEAGNEGIAASAISIVTGDVTDKVFMDKVIGDLKPALLILNAGATPVMGTIDEQDWEGFTSVWNIDVKAGLYGIQAALKTPMPKGSRVMIVSSGAALNGSSLSGGYAGAKRMLWLMAKYANEVSDKRGLAIRFQAILPTQIIGETTFGKLSATAIANSRNLSLENYLNAGSDKPFSAKEYAAYFIKVCLDKSYEEGIAYGIKKDGITKLE